MLVGVTGRNAAGKTAIIDWFVARGYNSSSLSDSIRIWLRQQKQEITRDNLIAGGRELRKQGGAGILAEMALEQIPTNSDHIIDSIRTPDEVHTLRHREGFVLIEIRAAAALRWKRLEARGRGGDATSEQEFIRQEEAELVAADSAGQALVATAELADVVLMNDATLDDLGQQLQTFVEHWPVAAD